MATASSTTMTVSSCSGPPKQLDLIIMVGAADGSEISPRSAPPRSLPPLRYPEPPPPPTRISHSNNSLFPIHLAHNSIKPSRRPSQQLFSIPASLGQKDGVSEGGAKSVMARPVSYPTSCCRRNTPLKTAFTRCLDGWMDGRNSSCWRVQCICKCDKIGFMNSPHNPVRTYVMAPARSVLPSRRRAR